MQITVAVRPRLLSKAMSYGPTVRASMARAPGRIIFTRAESDES